MLPGQPSQEDCAGGYYGATPNCIIAPPGTYAPAGSDAPIPSPAGTYIPFSGASSIAAAIATPIGTYAPAGSSAPIPAPAGTYIPGGGKSLADAIQTPAGTYAPAGSHAPTPAPAGTYIPEPGATSIAAAIVAPPGTYAPAGSSAPILAAAGTYISAIGASTPAQAQGCPIGSFSYGGAAACRAGSFRGTSTATPQLVSEVGNGGDVGAVQDGGFSTIDVRLSDNASGFAGVFGLHITDLSLLDISITGDDAFTLVNDLNGTVLADGDFAQLGVKFAPTATGDYSAVLHIVTDQYAGFGAPGEAFDIDLSGSGLAAPAPEPRTWLLMLVGLGAVGGLTRRRRRAARA